MVTRRIKVAALLAAHRRPEKKTPGSSALRVKYLNWLIRIYGPTAVGRWKEPPVSFTEWKLKRQLKAHK